MGLPGGNLSHDLKQGCVGPAEVEAGVWVIDLGPGLPRRVVPSIPNLRPPCGSNSDLEGPLGH